MGQPIVDQCRVVGHGVAGVHHWRQHLVFDLDGGERFLGEVSVDRGHGGDGVSFVKGLVLSHDVVAQELEVDHRAFGKVGGAPGGLNDVGAGYDGTDAGNGFSLAGVDGLDAGMRVWTAQDFAVQHPWQVEVGAVAGQSRDLVGSVVANRTGANDFILFVASQNHVGLIVQHRQILREIIEKTSRVPSPQRSAAPGGAMIA